VTTRIPYRAKSRVSGRVRERIAPLDALYDTICEVVSDWREDVIVSDELSYLDRAGHRKQRNWIP
jgi:hypothetical protein